MHWILTPASDGTTNSREIIDTVEGPGAEKALAEQIVRMLGFSPITRPEAVLARAVTGMLAETSPPRQAPAGGEPLGPVFEEAAAAIAKAKQSLLDAACELLGAFARLDREWERLGAQAEPGNKEPAAKTREGEDAKAGGPSDG
jgi:hypothetical protein